MSARSKGRLLAMEMPAPLLESFQRFIGRYTNSRNIISTLTTIKSANWWSNIVTMHRTTSHWILLIVVFLGGCSSTSLLYNNAPWLLREKIDDYFSITSLQERQLDRDIDLFFKWHRDRELPKYAKLIATFNREMDDGLSRAELSRLFDQIAAARIRIAEAGLQTASRFLASIDEEQLELFNQEFQQQMAEKREYSELSVEEQKVENFNRLLDTLEDWFGNFDQEQQLALRVISDARPRRYDDWLNRREQRQRAFMQLLRGKPDVPAIEAYLHRQYVQAVKQRKNQRQGENRGFWFSTILSIDKIVTPSQRQRAMDRLDGFRQDFIALSRQKTDVSRVEVER